QAAVGSAAVGTALGALTGAAIGSASGNVGAGAAIGAGTGLVAGSAVGAGSARAAGGSLQARYDTVYAQCMTAKGNRVAAPYVAEPVYVYPRPYYWGHGYYYRYGWEGEKFGGKTYWETVINFLQRLGGLEAARVHHASRRRGGKPC